MGYPELFGITLILVCSLSSFPRADGQETMTMDPGNFTQQKNPNFNGDARSTFKFPNHSKVQISGQIVRSPQGNWSRTGNASKGKGTADGEIFIFPDDQKLIPVTFTPKFGVTTPDCAKSSSFCEDVDNYPAQYLESILNTSEKAFTSMFRNDVSPTLQHRIDAIDDNPLCPSVEEIVYPKSAKNKEDNWLFVVNTGKFTQGVRIEKCLNTDSSKGCAFTEGFPLGYKTYCKQKYIYRSLVALNSEGKTITDTFQLPSCCACKVKVDHLLRSRVGNPNLRRTQNSTKSTGQG